MDIKSKRGTPNGQGNAAAEFSDFVKRAGDWSYGADCRFNDIESEKKEQDNLWGVPNQTEDSNAG